MTTLSKNIGAEEVRVIRDAEVTTIGAQTTTGSYADLSGSKVDAGNASSVALVVLNTHATQTIFYKVLASIDDITYVEVQAEASLAAVSGVGSYTTVNPAWRYYKAQVKNNSGAGTASGSVIVKN